MLNYLATYLMENDWGLKTLHLHLISSATYRMSSVHSEPAIAGTIDRFPTTRMQAETIWDNMLAVSGKLNGKMFGRSVFPPISDDLVIALRAEATDDELAVAAALPLVTAAAHIGELELLYPRSDSRHENDLVLKRGGA